MLESHPILSRVALIAILLAGFAVGGYALTGQQVIVSESRANTTEPQPSINPVVSRLEKSDRLVVASVAAVPSFLPGLRLSSIPDDVTRDFKALFTGKVPNVDLDDARVITKRVDLIGAIIKAAAATDVDPVYMIALADKESDLDPTEGSTRSSAQGLFQFVDGTWLELVKQYGPDHGLKAEADMIRMVGGDAVVSDDKTRNRILGLRDNPYLSAIMAGEMIRRDRDMLERAAGGRDLTYAEAYIGHFLGQGGATSFIEALRKSPHQSAPAAFPAAAAANPTIFYAEVAGVRRDLTVAQVYDRIARQIDMRVARYTGVGAGVAKLKKNVPFPGETSGGTAVASAPGTGSTVMSFAP